MSKGKGLVNIGVVVFFAVLAAVVVGSMFTQNIAQPMVEKARIDTLTQEAWTSLNQDMQLNYTILAHEPVSQDVFLDNRGLGLVDSPWISDPRYEVFCFRVLCTRTGEKMDERNFVYVAAWRMPNEDTWYNSFRHPHPR
jgi:hypothetical protein